MNCNCNHNGNSCGVPKQPNYNNLNKGFITPKKGCCDCGEDNKVCKNSKIITIDKNNIYPHEGIYLEDKPDGNQILHITLRPNDYTYVVNFKDGDNFYVTHIFIHYVEDNINNCHNIYKLYINNQKECNPIEIKIDDDLKQFNNFYIRELDNPDNIKYLKGKFFRLRSMRNLEIEVSKPMNSIRLYCDDSIIKNNLRTIIYNHVDSNNIIEDENGDLVANITLYLNKVTYTTTEEYCDKVYISFGDIGLCEEINYEYKLMIIDGANTGAEFIFKKPIIWANDEAPDINDGSLYEISISQNDFGAWFGLWAKY